MKVTCIAKLADPLVDARDARRQPAAAKPFQLATSCAAQASMASRTWRWMIGDDSPQVAVAGDEVCGCLMRPAVHVIFEPQSVLRLAPADIGPDWLSSRQSAELTNVPGAELAMSIQGATNHPPPLQRSLQTRVNAPVAGQSDGRMRVEDVRTMMCAPELAVLAQRRTPFGALTEELVKGFVVQHAVDVEAV